MKAGRIGASRHCSIALNQFGKKQYELGNHLGNVIAVVSDRKLLYTETASNVNVQSGFEGGDYSRLGTDYSSIATINDAHTGEKSVKLSYTGDDFGPVIRVPVATGDVINASVYGKFISGASSGLFVMTITDANGNLVNSAATGNPTQWFAQAIPAAGKGEWSQLTHGYTVPALTYTGTTYLNIFGWIPPGSSDTWFDDVSLTVNGAAPVSSSFEGGDHSLFAGGDYSSMTVTDEVYQQTQSVKLSSTGTQFGPGYRMIRVNAGDMINAEIYSKFEGSGSGGLLVMNLVDADRNHLKSAAKTGVEWYAAGGSNVAGTWQKSSFTNYPVPSDLNSNEVYLLVYPWVPSGAQPTLFDELKVTITQQGAQPYYVADVLSSQDYYSFGMEMPNQKFSGGYRYGFNGMEKDDEVKGSGNSYTTEFRQYDPRLGRWLSLDPLMAEYPHQSPYAAYNNNPIFFADPTGLEGDPVTARTDDGHVMSPIGGNTAFDKTWSAAVDGNLVITNGTDYKVWNPSTSQYEVGRAPKEWEGSKSLEEMDYGKIQLGDTYEQDLPDPYGVNYSVGIFGDSRTLQYIGGKEWILLEDFSSVRSAELATYVFPIGGSFKGGTALLKWLGVFHAGKKVLSAAGKSVFNSSSFADEIIKLNKATDGGGVLLNGTPSSAINSAMYYNTAAEQGASIFRSISGGHMFMNGNKRTAVAAFQSFAKIHGLKTVSQQEMMNVATQVATGQVTDVSQIAKMLIK